MIIKFMLLFNFDVYFTDEDETYNNPNLHSEEQDELELPDFFLNIEILFDPK